MALTVRNFSALVRDTGTGDMVPLGLLSNDSFASTTGTPHENYWAGATVRFNCKKMGKLVAIDFEGTPTVSFDAWYTFGTIPEGYRPPVNLYFFAMHNKSTALPMQITSNGSLQLFVNLPSLANLSLNAMYFI